MPKPDEDTIRGWRDAIKKKLSDETQHDIVMPYYQVSLAFPGGPHSASFDVQRIDWDEFQPWAKNLGWHVQSAPEVTYPEQKATPNIRFTRIDQG